MQVIRVPLGNLLKVNMKSIFIVNILICSLLFFLIILAGTMPWGVNDDVYIDSEYSRLSMEFKLLSELLPKINGQTNSYELQKIAVETFNSIQNNVQMSAGSQEEIDYFTIGDIQFYFDKKGYLERVERDELEFVNYSPKNELITTPSISYLFGKGNVIAKFNQGGGFMFIGLLIIATFLYAVIQYLRFEFRTKNLSEITKSSVALISVNFLCFVSLFFWNYQLDRGWFFSGNTRTSISVEHLLKGINDSALYPSLLFDIMMVSIVLTFIVHWRHNQTLSQSA